jgi:hypothetical protein
VILADLSRCHLTKQPTASFASDVGFGGRPRIGRQAHSKGGAGNAFVHTTTTTTVDANAVPTVTEDDVSVDCRG